MNVSSTPVDAERQRAYEQAADEHERALRASHQFFGEMLEHGDWLSDWGIDFGAIKHRYEHPLMEKQKAQRIARIERETAAVMALHRIWLANRGGDALTDDERIIAESIDPLLQEQICEAGEDAAEKAGD